MNQKNHSGRDLLKRLLAYTRPYKGRLWASILLAILLAGLAPLRPYIIQLSVDHYIMNRLWEGLIYITIVHFAILLLESLFRFLFTYFSNWLGQTVVHDLRQAVFRKIIYQNLSFFDRTPIGTLTTRTVNDIEAINEVFSQGLISIIADVLTIFAIIGIMLFTDWRLTLISLAVMPVLLLATYFFKESVKKSFQRVRNAVSRLNAFVQEHITGMYVIQIFRAEEREEKKFQTINEEHRNANISAIFAYSVFFPVVEIISAIALGLLVWYGAQQMLDYKVTQGVIIAFILYINLLFRPLRMLADKFNTLQMGIVAADRVFTVLDNQEFMKQNGTRKPGRLKGDVRFQDVHFSYTPGVPVLKGISFHAKAGETIALVGHTGAGKTSIISILNRMYEIDSGDITIDGVPLRDYDIFALRQQIGIVLQDIFLFSGTILENITLRNDEIPFEHVVKVCESLGVHEFIMQLPGDYHFNVRERGNLLSQGQRQLLSFARALLYDPSILILDEATASVDSESEILIQKAIEKLISGRTAIVIAHRLSTIRKADEIIVLDKGRIAEKGSHEELLPLKGIYYQMYEAAKTSSSVREDA